jgi:hypothetical protein
VGYCHEGAPSIYPLENSNRRTAPSWWRTLRILFGDVNQAVKGIRQSIAKRGLFGAKPMKQAAIAIAVSVTTTGAELPIRSTAKSSASEAIEERTVSASRIPAVGEGARGIGRKQQFTARRQPRVVRRYGAVQPIFGEKLKGRQIHLAGQRSWARYAGPIAYV